MNGKTMTGLHAGIALAALAGALATAAPALAQNEQFIPNLVYRTGAYAPNGVPFANGLADYYTLVNERDGGINGVKIAFEECDTGYATDRGVECYERLKGKGPTGAAFIVLVPIFLNQLPSWLGIPMSTAMISHIEFMLFGAMIVFFLIAEPHGLARMWAIAKEKLRLWPFPY